MEIVTQQRQGALILTAFHCLIPNTARMDGQRRMDEGFELHFHSPVGNENEGVATVEPAASNSPPDYCI